MLFKEVFCNLFRSSQRFIVNKKQQKTLFENLKFPILHKEGHLKKLSLNMIKWTHIFGIVKNMQSIEYGM